MATRSTFGRGNPELQALSWAMNGIADQPAAFRRSGRVSYGVEVKKHNPVVRQVANPLATSARVTIRLHRHSPIRTRRGTRGSSVSFGSRSQPMAAPGRNLRRQTITGKCTSPYDRSFRLRLPMNSSGSLPWSIRVTPVERQRRSERQPDPRRHRGDITTRNENKTLLNSITVNGL